ncbi:MAG: hypothetical protein NVS2B3_17920 [Vulcanimicrobiaceae bacterium]
MIFLIDYDRRVGRLNEAPIEFEESQRGYARQIRLERELLAAGDLNREIILLEARSLADIQTTHGRYFFTIDELKRRFS